MSLTPLDEARSGQFAAIAAVLTDIDDTLTVHGKLPAGAYGALSALKAAGFAVVPVTGRPAGWCDHMARMWPVDGIVGENGGFYFAYDATARRMVRVYAEHGAERRQAAKKLSEIAGQVLNDFPGTAIAADQPYRETDIAIDFREDVAPLGIETADAIARAFRAQGAKARVSSIHVNAWFGEHDKLTTSLRFLHDRLGWSKEEARARVAFCGDSPNDEPMFAFFPASFGVANIRPFAATMKHLPAFVAQSQGGDGFAEIARVLLKSRPS